MVNDQTGGAFGLQEPAQPRWCVVGNIVAQRLHGEHGEQRPGSKQFTGGTRVYFRSAYWGIGGESVTVLGLGRRPRRWITATVRRQEVGSRHLGTEVSTFGTLLEDRRRLGALR